MTFMVNHQGDLYEADLGEETEELAAATDAAYDPGDGWMPVLE